MASATKDNQELRKSDYKYLLQKYKTVEEANDFFKLQLQDLNARLKIEHKEKERLYQELKKARLEIVNKPSGHGALLDADIEEVNARLKEAYSKLEEEFELREQLNKDLEYTKNMLLAEGRVSRFSFFLCVFSYVFFLPPTVPQSSFPLLFFFSLINSHF